MAIPANLVAAGSDFALALALLTPIAAYALVAGPLGRLIAVSLWIKF